MKAKTLLIGLGKGGSALLPYLLAKDEFDLIAVCDSNPRAVGVAIAQRCGLTFYQSAVEAVQDLRPELAIDATGDPSLAGTLYEKRPAGTSVVTGEAAQLLWELLASYEAQRRWETRFNRVLDDMHSAMVVVQGGKIKFCNRSFFNLLGHPKSEVLGHPFANILDDEVRERDRGLYDDRHNGGERAAEEYDTKITNADQEIREVQIRSRRTDWEGSPAHLIVMNDVTELRHLQREREQFFRYMVHELRSPLSSLISTVSVFKEMSISENPERVEKLFSIVRRSADRLNGFVNDFLELSKIEKQHLSLKQQPIDLRELIEEEVEEQRILAEDKGLELRVEEWEPFDVHGDDFVIKTAVRNLVNNAVKYTDEGEIDVGVEKTNSSFRISVRDTGAGLTEEEQKHIFQEFGRIKRMDGMKGSGLGLALVKKLVDLAGGNISVESAGKGKGSTLNLELPCSFGEEDG